MSDATAFVHQFRTAAMEAMLAAMDVIRPFQTGARTIEGLELKPDDTIVTVVDRLSEAAITGILSRELPNLSLLREEGGLLEHSKTGRFIAWIDPVDGTRPLRAGLPGSTVIITLYDLKLRRIVVTLVGDPATGRIWTTTTKHPTKLSYVGLDGQRHIRPVQVWDGEMSRSTTVMIDNAQGFPRGGRQILTDENVDSLWGHVAKVTAVMNAGSNGVHHAIVANGNDTVVGAITTAQGGPWDCGGALTVLGAGGAAKGLRVTSDRWFEECDPLNPLDYDILVVANSDDTLDRLVHALYVCI